MSTRWLPLICLALALPGACSRADRSAERDSPPDTPTLIDLGGHRLQTFVKGQGNPAVVFEAGFSGRLRQSLALQDSIAAQTLTVAYERAGLGGSDPGPEPRSASQIAQELHILVQTLSISEPVVLVGHSAGAMFGRVFAHRYPDRVAALVLVDPFTEDTYDYWRTSGPSDWATVEQRAREVWNATSGFYAQWDALPQSIEEARAAWPLPDVPVMVFTALRPSPEEWPLATAARLQVFLDTHRKFVERTPNSRHIVLEAADHVSILNHAELSRAILEIVEAVRRGRDRRTG